VSSRVRLVHPRRIGLRRICSRTRRRWQANCPTGYSRLPQHLHLPTTCVAHTVFSASAWKKTKAPHSKYKHPHTSDQLAPQTPPFEAPPPAQTDLHPDLAVFEASLTKTSDVYLNVESNFLDKRSPDRARPCTLEAAFRSKME
jgi:hypothetical protein